MMTFVYYCDGFCVVEVRLRERIAQQNCKIPPNVLCASPPGDGETTIYGGPPRAAKDSLANKTVPHSPHSFIHSFISLSSYGPCSAPSTVYLLIMPATCTSIVRVGPADDDSNLHIELYQALFEYLGKNKDTSPQDDKTNLVVERLLHVSNRYFYAHIRLEDIGGDASNNEDWKEDGIMLMFEEDFFLVNESDNHDSHRGRGGTVSKFDSLTALHDHAVQENGAGDLLRLCVSISKQTTDASYKTTKQYEQEYARRIHWCLDRGYEYVECDLSALDQGHEDRDKEGFARILEAIRGTVWSSAVMAAPKPKTSQINIQVETLEEEGFVNEYEPPDPSKLPPIEEATIGPTTEEDMIREKLARKELLDDCDDQGILSENMEERKREQEEEQLFHSMESALKQAAQIRDASRAGSLSDDERRKRAGEAASLLMHLMDQMGFDDEDEDSVDNDEDEPITDQVVDALEESVVDPAETTMASS